jgi:DNA replication and repair protein RecF
LHLIWLELRNYRNYGRLDLEPGPRLNLFLGANGQGKTNLLESVAMLALSSSPRARRDSELVGPLAPEARIAAGVETGSRRAEVRISIVLDGERARRRIEVDGQGRRAVDLPGLFRVTLFWPDDLNLVKSGPEHRRRLLNQMLVQVEPGYARALGRYSRVLEQRNSLLKQVWSGEQPRSALEVWDLELASLGGEIADARGRAMESLLKAVENSRSEDLRRGSTSVGPHRDDILLKLAGRDARGFASQGQQRTAVVSVKLAEAELVARMTGERPVLLLDDVLSELDGDRRRALLESLGEPGQVVITSVEAEPFPASVIGSSRVRCIEAGRVQSCG